MQLKNEFEVQTGVDQAWDFFTDLAQVMPCMPGAALEGVEGENYLGSVNVKVGPIAAHFRGTAHFEYKDASDHSAVIVAAGKDPKGQAAASAQIHARLEPVSATRTRVLIDTDLDISGRMAQFGRGAIADVSSRLLGQFVANISDVIDTDDFSSALAAARATPTSASGTGPAAAPQVTSSSDAGDSMDLMALVLPMVKERYGQAILGGLIGFALSWIAFGRKGRPPQAQPYIAWASRWSTDVEAP